MLPVDAQHRLSQLNLLAQGVVAGLAAGRHRAPHVGASLQFKEHRSYLPGDELRHIDWKLFGKTDRLLVRHYEDETNLQALVVVDQSGSMAYRGQQAPHSKHQFAIQLAACLSSLLIKQQDCVGLATIDQRLQQAIGPRGTASHLRLILEGLLQSACGGEGDLPAGLNQAASLLRQRGLLLLISDCFDGPECLLPALRLFRQRHHEVIIFQVWDRDELEFPFSQPAEFRSLEHPSQQRVINPQGVRQIYLQRLQDYRLAWASRLERERIDLVTCITDQDLGQLLAGYLQQRAGKRRRSSSGRGSG